MKKTKKSEKVTNKPDSRLAGNKPTAQSPEFVPKPISSIKYAPTNSTEDYFDIIPQLKTEKYKR